MSEIGAGGGNVGKLTGKVALVTGSSRGIGKAIAGLFADEGAAVAVHGRDEGALKAVLNEVTNRGGRAIAVSADVTRFEEIERARREIEDQLGPVDILVANAGASPIPPCLLEDIPEDGWRKALDVNLTATFLTIKSFLPGMKARGTGNIITISSAAGRRPHPKSPMAYAAAKAGIQLLSQAIAAQAGPFGVRVNCIAPETIMTERNEERIPSEQIPNLIDAHPIKRLGTPEDVAKAALFLATDQSDWITGVILDVAGGAVMVG
jgi:3-oxoacyl-[acyl-carrier protein] reductase